MKKHVFIEFLIPILCQIIIYIVQFIVIPLFVTIYPSNSSVNTAYIIIATILLSAPTLCFFSKRFSPWVIGIIPYAVLLFLYRPYGIAEGPFAVDIPFIILLVLAIELVEWIGINAYKWFNTRKKEGK